eukprot:GDKK01063282.1.p1 GENE.GDKK01063282.1~~GDKK01063282.1.p1  ORF type:complete len:247 (-),score=45.54 GDKK01063282.1:139-807(-)
MDSSSSSSEAEVKVEVKQTLKDSNTVRDKKKRKSGSDSSSSSLDSVDLELSLTSSLSRSKSFSKRRSSLAKSGKDSGAAPSQPLPDLKKTVQIMNEVKTSGVMLAALKVTDLSASVLSHRMFQRTAMDVMMRHTCVFSNVPGPNYALRTFGCQLDELYMVYANPISQTGIISYNERVTFVITVDSEHFKDSDLLGDLYIKELIQLAREAGLSVCEEDVYFYD